jgi:hypothetical protein
VLEKLRVERVLPQLNLGVEEIIKLLLQLFFGFCRLGQQCEHILVHAPRALARLQNRPKHMIIVSIRLYAARVLLRRFPCNCCYFYATHGSVNALFPASVYVRRGTRHYLEQVPQVLSTLCRVQLIGQVDMSEDILVARKYME